MASCKGPMFVVFGGTGFIGRAVAAVLKERHQSFIGFGRRVAIRSSSSSLPIGDTEARRRLLSDGPPPRAIIVAVGSANAVQERHTLLASHLQGLRDCLDAIPADWRNGLKVLYTSSALVYGRRSSPAPIKETEPALSNTIYAETKLACENHLFAWGEAHGARPVVVRLFNVTGTGQRTSTLPLDIARQAGEIIEGRRNAFHLRSSMSLLDLVLAKEAAHGLLALAIADTAPTVFNLCSGRVLTACDLVAATNRHIGRNASVSFDIETGPPEALIGYPEKMASVTGWRAQASADEIMQEVMSGVCDEAVAHG